MAFISATRDVGRRRVLCCGDLNVAFGDRDFYNPQEPRVKKQAGTTPEERTSFGKHLLRSDHRSSERPSPSCAEEGDRDDVSSSPVSEGSTGLPISPQCYSDAFRLVHGDEASGVYSYWSTRARNRQVNRGLRIDYVLASPATVGDVTDAFVLDDVLGSDHCPVGVDISMPLGFVLDL